METTHEDDMALCAIGRLENRYARDFVNYYKNLGVSHIYIYDNNRPGEERFSDVLQDYVDEGYVTIVTYPHDYGCQIKAYNDCIKNYGKNHTWMAFFDFDEYLSFDAGCNIHDMLCRCKTFDVITVCWKMYDDNDLLDYDGRFFLDRFTREVTRACGDYSDDSKHETIAFHKSILRCGIPDIEFKDTVHLPSHRNPIRICTAAGKQPLLAGLLKDKSKLTYEVAHLKHFSTRTLGEWLARKNKIGGAVRGPSVYKDTFFKVNHRTPEKDRLIAEWVDKHPDDKRARHMLLDYRIWESYTEDCLHWVRSMKSEDKHHRHYLFPVYKDMPEPNINKLHEIYGPAVTMWYVWHNKFKTPCVGFAPAGSPFNPSRLPSSGECAYSSSLDCQTIYDHYKFHNIEDMDLAIDFLEKEYGHGNKYTEYLKNGTLLIQNTCFMTRWEDFDKLCSFLFPILEYVAKESGCNDDIELWHKRTKDRFPGASESTLEYQSKSMAFLTERLVSAYIIVNTHYYR